MNHRGKGQSERRRASCKRKVVDAKLAVDRLRRFTVASFVAVHFTLTTSGPPGTRADSSVLFNITRVATTLM